MLSMVRPTAEPTKVATIHSGSMLTLARAMVAPILTPEVERLDAILADGPLAKADIVKLARHEGYGERPLRTAQQRLKVIAERDPTRQGRPSDLAAPGHHRRHRCYVTNGYVTSPQVT